MAAHRQPRGNHFLYVWNPDTDWYQDFEHRQRKEALGLNFGGYSNGLGTICLWMGKNRHVLKETASQETEAMFHLLIPEYYPIVIEKLIIFHQSLFTLVITARGIRMLTLSGSTYHPFLSASLYNTSEL